MHTTLKVSLTLSPPGTSASQEDTPIVTSGFSNVTQSCLPKCISRTQREYTEGKDSAGHLATAVGADPHSRAVEELQKWQPS